MAYNIIVSEEGKSFDPCLVRLFVERFDEFRQIAIDHFEENPNDSPFKMSGRDLERQNDNISWQAVEVSVSKHSDINKREKDDY